MRVKKKQFKLNVGLTWYLQNSKNNKYNKLFNQKIYLIILSISDLFTEKFSMNFSKDLTLFKIWDEFFSLLSDTLKLSDLKQQQQQKCIKKKTEMQILNN